MHVSVAGRYLANILIMSEKNFASIILCVLLISHVGMKFSHLFDWFLMSSNLSGNIIFTHFPCWELAAKRIVHYRHTAMKLSLVSVLKNFTSWHEVFRRAWFLKICKWTLSRFFSFTYFCCWEIIAKHIDHVTTNFASITVCVLLILRVGMKLSH